VARGKAGDKAAFGEVGMLKMAILAGLALSSAALGRGLEATPGLAPASPRMTLDRATYAGRPALHVVDRPAAGGCCLVALPGQPFHDGTIEGWIAGGPRAGASAGARGFIGLAFRTQTDGRYEAFYIRPTNGRADDQLRRNHATQYISEPAFPWERLRRETPGVYESYVDLEAGAWTHLRIEVTGNRARLYVNHAPQPALIVNDLKLGADAAGGVALWIGDETEGWFADVRVTPER
jgi:hypothetical protein